MKRLGRPLRAVLAATALAWAIGSDAAAMEKEPDGVLKAKFGMTPQALKLAYPDAVEEAVPTPAAGESVQPFKLPRYTIKRQTVGPLRNCTLGANFFNEYLYQVQVSCPAKKGEIEAYLEKAYGAPGHSQKPFKTWTGAKTSISYTSASGVFLAEDKKYSQSVNMTILHYALSHGVGAAPPATPAPHNLPTGGSDSSRQ